LKEGINESGGFVRSGKWCGRRAFPTADLRRCMILRPVEFVAMSRHRYRMSGIGPEANPRLSPYLLRADGAERRENRSRSEKASLKKGGEARASMLFGETSFPIGLRAAGAESLPTFSGAVLKKCAHSDTYIDGMTTQPLLANLADASPGMLFFSLAFPCIGLRAAEAGPLPTFSGAFLKKCTRFGVNSSSMTSHPLMTDSGDAGSSLPFFPATFPCGCTSKKRAVGFLEDRGRDLGPAALYRPTPPQKTPMMPIYPWSSYKLIAGYEGSIRCMGWAIMVDSLWGDLERESAASAAPNRMFSPCENLNLWV
jgi:hypothetical protein